MQKPDKKKSIRAAIVGGGRACKRMLDILCSDESLKAGIRVLGIACSMAVGEGYRCAKRKGIATAEDYRDVLKLKHLNLIIVLSQSKRLMDGILSSKPDHVDVMPCSAALFFMDLYGAQRNKIAECEQSLDSFKEQAEDYWSLFDNAVAALYRTGIEDGRVIMCNERLAQILGYKNREEVIAKYNVAENYVDRNRRDELIDVLNRFKKVEDFEVLMKRKDGSHFWANLSAVIFPEKGYLEGMLVDMTERKLIEEENKMLVRQLIRIQEEERKRIARDLHDALGQALSSLQFSVGTLRESIPGDLASPKSLCDKIVSDIEQVGDTVRRISSNLRPAMLDHLGLVPALEWYIGRFMERHKGLAVDFQVIGFKKRLDPEIEIALYRVLQEALANIAKHSMATRVRILLTFSYPKVIMTIRDNGIGFDGRRTKSSSRSGFEGVGLPSMRERIGAAGGHLEIRSAQGRGTSIRVELAFSANQV